MYTLYSFIVLLNLLDRRIENELVPLCQRYGLAIIPWSPLAMGVLAGRYSRTGATQMVRVLRTGMKKWVSANYGGNRGG